MKRLSLFTLAGLLALTGTGHAADELFPDKILVKGDGFEIKQSQLDQAYMQRKSQMAAAGQNIPESARPMVERQTLDLLILKHLLLKKATPEDRAEAAKIVESQISLAPEGSLSSQARLLGLTDEAFKKELVDQNSAQRVVAREFEPKAVVTEQMSRKFYNENLNKFEQPEMVRAAHVLFLTKTEQGADLPEAAVKEKRAAAEKVLERARKGEDFAALAKEFSEDPGSKDSGGEYTFPRGQMVPEFEKTAFEQKPGQISDLVTTGFGFHIIKTLEKIPPMVQEFSEAEPNIKAYLTRLELQRLLQEFTEAGRKDPKLEILDERFKS
jgi:parvulin-like peptidyl-prolyl isomerase